MKRLAAFALLLCGMAAAWTAAGRMQISRVTDVDAHITSYRAHCDSIVAAYLGKNEAGRLTADKYLDMLARLKACNQIAATPSAN